jgi:hypothetical protein
VAFGSQRRRDELYTNMIRAGSRRFIYEASRLSGHLMSACTIGCSQLQQQQGVNAARRGASSPSA